MSEFQRATEVAIRAALGAGEIALQGFRARDLKIDVKSDMHDLVTHYDGACESYIREAILAAYPDSSIIGEENEAVAGVGRLSWFVDPIDGTANFARGIALWAISIGVALDGELIAGVIFDPANAQLFWADERGAFLRDTRVPGAAVDRPMRSWGYTVPAQATLALNFPLARDLAYRPELALSQFAEITQNFGQIRGLHSTCIALAWVAAGWVDATISFETSPWDVSAGAYIIRRAGGVFTGYRGGQAVPAAESHLAPHYFAAVPGAEFAMLHEVMRTQSMRPETGSAPLALADPSQKVSPDLSSNASAQTAIDGGE
ncbi:inositol monophosphatase family protein [Leucobacter sp. UT-8R-CII-1-4]|uniref:inositol monophosphatase family protein n=1 Tax=Leucobacter sp. UT-8R-CII-1-4 TaxID=3040075 RepID=UPI0024A83F17|nr:inositol monophosphatase family protein [Leucobacter sp. UT-8R-CII-1-4]MDI6022066.1 inositol monophosphatase family protein [Leucobacter sp. UT-8R-CII-1-4]